ncbi:MAG: type II toxin-antitoxin system VapC family toxin [Pyrinomonadaceae bacterium]
MNKTFIDTSFSIAPVSEKDEDHARAIELSLFYEDFPMLTTNCILLEIGNSLTRNFRQETVVAIDNFLLSEEIEVVSLNQNLFDKAFALYQTHKDKTWGLVDCVSFTVMRENNITNALTNDKHFQQAGFNALMRND